MRTNFSTQAKFGKAVERDGTRSGGGTNGPCGGRRGGGELFGEHPVGLLQWGPAMARWACGL